MIGNKSMALKDTRTSEVWGTTEHWLR